MKVTLEDGECRMCGRETKTIVNINFKATSICDSCCNSIMLQTAHALVEKENAKNTQSELNSQQNPNPTRQGVKIGGANRIKPKLSNESTNVASEKALNLSADTQIQNEINKDYALEGTEVKQ